MAVAGHWRNGAGNHSPQMMTDVTGTWQYGILIKLDGSAWCWKRVLATNVITTYDLSGAASNALGLPFLETDDDHHALALGVDENGRVHIAGNSFATSLRYIRSTASGGQADITAWSSAVGSVAHSSGGVNAHTYHDFVRTANGTLIWSMDQRAVLTDGLGIDRLLFKLIPGASATWQTVLSTNKFATSERVTNGDANRAFLIGLTATADGWLHAAGIWRTGDDDGDTQQQPWYLKAHEDELDVWYNVEDVVHSMPITWANRAAAQIDSAPGFSPTNGKGIAIDGDGYPHVVLRNGTSSGAGALTDPETLQQRTTWVRCFWNGTTAAWEVADISGAGSTNGPCLHGVRDELLLIGSISGRCFIRTNGARGTTISGGSLRFWMGGPVDTTYDPLLTFSAIFEPNPDPVRLQSGWIDLMIPDGDTVKVFSFGSHARFVAA